MSKVNDNGTNRESTPDEDVFIGKSGGAAADMS